MGVAIATLRAPPAKWAIKAFFPAGERSEPRSRTARRAPADRSPRRAAGRAASGVAVPPAFFGTFFRFERKYFPPLGAAVPPSAPESARQAPGRNCFRQSCLIMPLAGGFSLAPCTPSVRLPKRIYNPTGLYLHSRAGVGASGPVSENCLRQR